MNFISLVFITALPVIVLLYRILPKRIKPALLLISSWAFYLYGSPSPFWMLLAVTVISYVSGILLTTIPAKRTVLIIGSVTILSFLVACKYIKVTSSLPVGISFYTFQTFAYLIDVYKGSHPCEKNFFDFSLFVAFFPQLVAGPIERPGKLIPQLKEVKNPSKADFSEGIPLLITGYFKKVVVADYIATYVDIIFTSPEYSKGLIVFLGAILFAIQIYADFSGYSDIARGCGKLLGIELDLNFNHPYLAENIRDFWRKWHITLTSWFTDYIYIPLGGNRKGTLRKILNTLIVFGLSGIWHGSGLKFFIWGLGHGLLILFEDLNSVKKLGKKLPKCINMLINFFFVSFLWIFFRAETFTAAKSLICGLFTGITDFTGFLSFCAKDYALMLICSLLLYLVPKYTEKKGEKNFIIMYLLVIIIIGAKINQIRSGIQNSFIYFNF